MFSLRVRGHPLVITAHGLFRLDKTLSFAVRLHSVYTLSTRSGTNVSKMQYGSALITAISFHRTDKYIKHRLASNLPIKRCRTLDSLAFASSVLDCKPKLYVFTAFDISIRYRPMSIYNLCQILTTKNKIKSQNFSYRPV